MVFTADTFYFYILDVDSAAAESSPNIISPDANSGNKRWILIFSMGTSGIITLSNTGLHLLDTGGNHDLIIKPGSDVTADRTLTLTTGDSDRTITLSGNPTLADWFDQAVKAASSPTFNALTITSLTIGTETELTIATGAITVTQTRHKVDTEADAASDDLVTINGGATVNMIVLRAEADGRTVVVKHGTGNIWLQGKADISLDDLEDGILLFWDSTNSKWFDIVSAVSAAANLTDEAPVVGDGGVKGVKSFVATIFNLIQDSRSQFTYFDADQITCGAAQYMCKDKYCYWVSTITTVATGAAGGIDWWYLYLDYSAITSGTAITASELIWSTTEPSWNTAYRQWMNGDDRCIFAVETDASNNILEFYHDGDLVVFANAVRVTNAAVGSSTNWIDSVQAIPKFSRRAEVIFYGYPGDVSPLVYWRTNGQTGTSGHFLFYPVAGGEPVVNTLTVITDAIGIIEYKFSIAGTVEMTIDTSGWYFPTGL